MVMMSAKWAGRCKLCGVTLPQDTMIEWTREGGARHVSPEACAEALANPPAEPTLRGSGVELPDDRKRIEALLRRHPWKSVTERLNAATDERVKSGHPVGAVSIR